MIFLKNSETPSFMLVHFIYLYTAQFEPWLCVILYFAAS
jgi:hypothetical protein